MGYPTDERGRRAPTPSALASLPPIPDGFRVLPDPLHGQPLLRIPARPADVRIALDRSHESALADEPSQDYLAVRRDARRLSFAVTDGVGSSFLGDVAAQILAIQLAEWLAAVSGGDHVGPDLERYLSELSTEVAERVANWPIAESVPALIRAALDQQRAYGSEAMFVGGTVDLSGRRDAKVTVVWLGDSRLRVVMRDGRTSDYSGRTTDRWSSRLGHRGQVQSRTWPFADVARIMACTDGLLPALDATVTLPDTALQERLREQARRPGNDDLALVDIGLVPDAMPAGVAANPTLWRRLTDEPQRRHARATPAGSALRRIIRAVGPVAGQGGAPSPVPETVPGLATEPGPEAVPVPDAPRTPAEPRHSASTVDSHTPPGVAPPGQIVWRRIDRGRELNWEPVPGADSYAIQLCREKTFAEPLNYTVPGLTFALPPLGPPLFGRVRSVAGDKPGPWGPVYDLTERPSGSGAS
jgi:hypothetical protein